MPHTPAPWKVTEEGIEAENGVFVASSHGPEGAWPDVKPEHDANANLIAAAPKLLSGIERLLNCPDLNLDELEEETRAAIAEARATIAQAKGEN